MAGSHDRSKILGKHASHQFYYNNERKRLSLDEIEYDSFQWRTEFTAFELRVDGMSFFVNPRYLAETSPVFAALCLNGNFKEKMAKLAMIHEEKSEDILELLRCIYPCSPYLTPKPVSGTAMSKTLDNAKLGSISVSFPQIPPLKRWLCQGGSDLRFRDSSKIRIAGHRFKLGVQAHGGQKILSNYVASALFIANRQYTAESGTTPTFSYCNNNAISSNQRSFRPPRSQSKNSWFSYNARRPHSTTTTNVETIQIISSHNHLFL